MSDSVCFVSLRAYGYFEPESGFRGGGAERQINLVSTALADEFDVHVIVGDFGQPQAVRRDGVTLHRAYPLHDRRNVFQPVKHLLLLWAAMRRADADVYVHRGFLRSAGFVYLMARLLRARWVFNVANDTHVSEDPASLPRPIRRLYAHAVRNADAVVAQTDRQRRGMGSEYGVDAHVVPNGYPRADDPLPFDERDGFLWVGRLAEDQKRPHLFLDAAERFESETFRIAGPAEGYGRYAQEIVERAESLPNVEYLGLVPPDEIHEEYRRALALVNTSAYEGFPNTYLEAWRQGTPVVGIDVDPARYLQTDADAVGAVADVDALVERCRRLTSEAEFWSQASAISLDGFESNYLIDEVADRYAHAIRDALGRTQRSDSARER